MNRHKGGITLRVRDRNALPEWNENIAVARHHHPIPTSSQHGAEASRDVEREVFLSNALAGHTATIKPAVAGIDDDRFCLRVGVWRRRSE